jgi:toxin-antitoxin system PIN domain toxin
VILLDVNVLVTAAHRDATGHDVTADWLEAALAGPEPVGLADLALTGAMRVLTSRRIFADPVPPAAALDFVDAVREAPAARSVTATTATWQRFAALVRPDPAVHGNLVPDAWLAALALSHGGRLATFDRGFARFPGLVVQAPAAVGSPDAH